MAVTACAPMVTHPPRTEPGIYVGTTAGFGLPNDSVLVLPMTPQLGPYLRYSDRASSGWGGSGSVALNLGARAGLQADLYVEVPSRDAALAHGAGVLTGGNFVMPYLQVGRQRVDGSGWYLTQGYAWRGYVEASGLLDQSTRVRPRYWSTTITGRRDRRGESVEVYASGSLGHYDHERFDPQSQDATLIRRRLWTLAVGITLEQNLRKLFDRYPPRGPSPGGRRPVPTPPPVPLP